MTMIGTVFTGIALFIGLVNLVLAYICLILANPVKRIASRTVPREKIPVDWNRIMEETVIERRDGKDDKD